MKLNEFVVITEPEAVNLSLLYHFYFVSIIITFFFFTWTHNERWDWIQRGRSTGTVHLFCRLLLSPARPILFWPEAVCWPFAKQILSRVGMLKINFTHTHTHRGREYEIFCFWFLYTFCTGVLLWLVCLTSVPCPFEFSTNCQPFQRCVNDLCSLLWTLLILRTLSQVLVLNCNATLDTCNCSNKNKAHTVQWWL